LELAFGDRTTTTNSTDGYEAATFTVDRPLPTATLLHRQTDADLQTAYVGCKASATFSWSQGDPLSVDFSFTAQSQADPTTADSYSTNLPEGLQPFRSEMQGVVTITNDQGLNEEIATVTGGELGIDNGLEVNHHGRQSPDNPDGREGYSVSEETNAERFTDQTLEIKPTDKSLYERAANNEANIDYEVPFVRAESSGVITDGIIIRGNDTPVADFPMPFQEEGSLETTMTLQPTEFEVEIRTPL
jgi:hypothetical protein